MALENYVKFLRGTPTAYKNLAAKDKDTLYFVTASGENWGSLYLGETLIASGAGEPETITLASLKDVTIAAGVQDGSVLVYDVSSDTWVNKSLDDVLSGVVAEMIGASATTDGFAGLVPAPKAGEHDHFLKGDGTWAKVATESQVFHVEPQGEEDHLAAIARVVGETELLTGNIAIVKEVISEGKYQHTAYVYDKSLSAWKAMDGNYNAESVYFDEDLLTTSAVGVIELTNGQATIAAAGKNLKEVFNTIFVKEENPETTDPSVTVSLPTAGSYEVGSSVGVSYSVALDGGSYSYGPETGVTPTTYSVTDGAVVKTTASGSFDNVLVTDDFSYRLTATVGHTEGAIPVTNTGNPYEEGKIESGNAVGYSGYITGFRPFFYGMSKVAKADMVYDSAFIRGLTNGGNYNAKKTLTFTAAELEGVKRFVIAIPSKSITSTRTGISSAIIKSSMNADALDFYVELDSTVYVQGKDGHTATVPYRVWVYEPTSIAAEEVHEVVLK